MRHDDRMQLAEVPHRTGSAGVFRVVQVPLSFPRGKEEGRCRLMARMSYAVDANGCHIWSKARNSRGYGVVWHDGKLRLAHRVAWLLAHGSWPADGLVVDHVCNVKECVNAAHLRELPNHENLRRAVKRGNSETERRRRKWREANARRRNYGPLYTIGGE